MGGLVRLPSLIRTHDPHEVGHLGVQILMRSPGGRGRTPDALDVGSDVPRLVRRSRRRGRLGVFQARRIGEEGGQDIRNLTETSHLSIVGLEESVRGVDALSTTPNQVGRDESLRRFKKRPTKVTDLHLNDPGAGDGLVASVLGGRYHSGFSGVDGGL